MRHLDYLLEEWNLEAESEALRACVSRLREGIDRYYIYLEAVDGAAGPDPGEVFESLFERGWLGRRWGLRRQLGRLFRMPMADDRARPMIWLVRWRARRTERLLSRLEAARRSGRADRLAGLREALASEEERMLALVRPRAFELFRERSPHACPACGGRYVKQEQYFGGVTLLGCELCAHAESGREGSEELAGILRRWAPPA